MTAPLTAAPAFRQVDQLTGEVADLRCRCEKLTRWHSDAMTALDAMRHSRDEALAARDYARTESRVTAEALQLSHSVRDELSDEYDRIAAEVEQMREENADLRADVALTAGEMRRQELACDAYATEVARLLARIAELEAPVQR